LDAGISPSRTAELIGTSVATVRNAQTRSKLTVRKQGSDG
jgi:DNA-binding CsgD family transcriptional regulator